MPLGEASLHWEGYREEPSGGQSPDPLLQNPLWFRKPVQAEARGQKGWCLAPNRQSRREIVLHNVSIVRMTVQHCLAAINALHLATGVELFQRSREVTGSSAQINPETLRDPLPLTELG